MRVEMPLCTLCHHPGYKLLIWKGEGQDEGGTTLEYLTRALSAHKGADLCIIADCRLMTCYFAAHSLTQWLSKLREAPAWQNITRCIVVTDSAALLQVMASLFTPEPRVQFCGTVEEATAMLR